MTSDASLERLISGIVFPCQDQLVPDAALDSSLFLQLRFDNCASR